jgi:ferrous-iron efflux pump FieF
MRTIRGHGKVESLSAGVAATIIALGGTFVVIQAVRRLVGDQPDINVGVGLAAMITAAIVNLLLAFFMGREARRSSSLALRAESTHLQTNVVQAATIIAGLLLVAATGKEVFDPLVALGLAAYMGYTAYGLVRTALSEIMDEALPAWEIDIIEKVLETHPEVRAFHRLRTRRIGATRQVDMHMTVAATLTVAQVHDVSDDVEREIEGPPGTVAVIHIGHEEGTDFEIVVRYKTGSNRSRLRAAPMRGAFRQIRLLRPFPSSSSSCPRPSSKSSSEKTLVSLPVNQHDEVLRKVMVSTGARRSR